MKIIVDKEGMGVILGLCDRLLRLGGLSQMDAINQVRPIVKMEKPEPEKAVDNPE